MRTPAIIRRHRQELFASDRLLHASGSMRRRPVWLAMAAHRECDQIIMGVCRAFRDGLD